MADTPLAPTLDDLTKRSRVMRVEIDRDALAARAKKAADASADAPTDDEEAELAAGEDDDEEAEGEDGEDGEDTAERAARRLARRQQRAAATADLLPISISSEFPVERMDWWTGERYEEVLAHTKEAIDLSRAADGLPFLDSHDAYEGKARMGRVLNVRLGADGKLRGDVLFSKRRVAQELRQDFLDGIAREISVGYRIDQNNIETSQAGDGPVVKRIKRWTPYEVSSVSVPADPTVGAGRSADEAARRSRTPSLVTAPQGQERTVSDTTTAAPDSGTATNTPEQAAAIRVQAAKDERERAAAITALGEDHKVEPGRVRQWIAEGTDLNAVRSAILDLRKSQAAGSDVAGKPVVELTDKERREYSLVRALNAAADRAEGKKANSFELELSDTIRKALPASVATNDRGGFMIPMSTRAGLDSATSTKGVELKFTVPGDFIDILRNKMAVMKMGATLMSGLQGPVAFPNQTGAGTATWVGENPGSDVADSNLTLQQITLSPKTLQSSTSYSRQLLAQAVFDVESLVRNDLAAIHALAVDSAAVNGTGSSNQPTGILATSGIGSVAMGTNGATLTNSALVDLETQVTAANADLSSLGYLVTPGLRGTLKKAQVLSNTVGLPAWQNDGAVALNWAQRFGQGAVPPGIVNGYTAYATAQMPSNLTKGTSSGICHAVLFGAWSQLVIGDWGAYEVVVDPYRLKKQGMIEVTSFQMVGIMVRYAAAFAAIKDALL